jgi:hypothetical protein
MITLIEPEPVGGMTCERKQDLEENNYEYTEDLGDDQSTGATSHPTS